MANNNRYNCNFVQKWIKTRLKRKIETEDTAKRDK